MPRADGLICRRRVAGFGEGDERARATVYRGNTDREDVNLVE